MQPTTALLVLSGRRTPSPTVAYILRRRKSIQCRPYGKVAICKILLLLLSPFNMCTLKLILLPIQREDVGLFSFIRGCDSHGPTGVDPNRSVALGPSRSQAEVLAPTATRVPLPIVLQFDRKLLEYLQSCGPFSALKTYAKGKIMPNRSLWVVGNCVKW